jgi:hypothetical protein
MTEMEIDPEGICYICSDPYRDANKEVDMRHDYEGWWRAYDRIREECKTRCVFIAFEEDSIDICEICLDKMSKLIKEAGVDAQN